MNKMITGLIMLAIGLWAVVSWWWFLWDIIRGLIAILLVFGGLILIGLGVRNFTSARVEKSE